MKKKFIIFIAIGVGLFTITRILYPQAYQPITVFRRGVEIGDIKLTGKRLDEGYNLLKTATNQPIYLNLNTNSKAVTLKEIGLEVELDSLTKLTMTCPFSFAKVFCKNTSNEQLKSLNALYVDEERLKSFLDQTESEVQFLAENVIISFEDYSFRVLSPEATIKLDRTQFETKENLAQLLSEDRVKVKVMTTPVDNTETQKALTTQLADNMVKPLLIKYGRNPITIDSTTVGTFIDLQEHENGLLYGYIEKDPINEYLLTLKEDYSSEDVEVVHDKAIEFIQRALVFRATDYQINNAVILPLEGKPKTDGTLHDVYLEVIKSQQRLYRWENGEVTKTYIVSTGLTWETPPGEYQVLGKQKMTISYFGNWYMPNYLPVGTINGYRFGFHAIPYHMDAGGNIYSRDPNTMGSPATGGCIQLTEAESLELFNWAEVGTPVYIYE